MTILVVFLFAPRVALAGSNNNFCVYGPIDTTWEGVDHREVGVVSNNRYDACLVAIGMESYVTSLTAAQKVVLQNNNSGSAFKLLANQAVHMDGTDYGISEHGPFPGFWATANATYGRENVWYWEDITGSQLEAARKAVRDAARGGSSGTGGGGSSGGTGGVGLVPSVMTMYYSGISSKVSDKDSATLELDDTRRERYDELLAEKDGYNWFIGLCTSLSQCYLIAYDSSLLLTFDEDGKFVGIKNDTDNDALWFRSEKSNLTWSLDENDNLVFSALGNSTDWIQGETIPAHTSKTYWNTNYLSVWGVGDVSGGDLPIDPPIDWPDPDPPVTPDPPELPGPGDPVTPLPPEPPVPWEPIPGIGITITGDDFQDLLDALDEHCKHLQSSITNNIGQLWENQSGLLSDLFDWMGNDVVIASFNHLEGYLSDLFDWMGQRLDYDFSTFAYDDSDLKYLVSNGLSRVVSAINGIDLGVVPYDDSVFRTLVRAGFDDVLDGLDNLDFETYDDSGFRTLVGGRFDTLDSDIEGWVDDILNAMNDISDTFLTEVRFLNECVNEIHGWASEAYRNRGRLTDFFDDVVDSLDTIIYQLTLNRYVVVRDYRPTPTELRDKLNMDELDAALRKLMEKFPFSTINNIALIFAYLHAPAVAPEFDVPVPNPSDWSSPHMMHVSLEQFDTVARVMRLGWTLWAIAIVSKSTTRMWTHREGV